VNNISKHQAFLGEKLGSGHDVKSFATGAFLEHIVKRANDDFC